MAEPCHCSPKVEHVSRLSHRAKGQEGETPVAGLSNGCLVLRSSTVGGAPALTQSCNLPWQQACGGALGAALCSAGAGRGGRQWARRAARTLLCVAERGRRHCRRLRCRAGAVRGLRVRSAVRGLALHLQALTVMLSCGLCLYIAQAQHDRWLSSCAALQACRLQYMQGCSSTGGQASHSHINSAFMQSIQRCSGS